MSLLDLMQEMVSTHRAGSMHGPSALMLCVLDIQKVHDTDIDKEIALRVMGYEQTDQQADLLCHQKAHARRNQDVLA